MMRTKFGLMILNDSNLNKTTWFKPTYALYFGFTIFSLKANAFFSFLGYIQTTTSQLKILNV